MARFAIWAGPNLIAWFPRERFVAQLQGIQIYHWRDPVAADRSQQAPPKTHFAVESVRPKGRWQAVLRRLAGLSIVSALAGICLAAGLGYITVIAGILSAAALLAMGFVRWGLWILDNVPF